MDSVVPFFTLDENLDIPWDFLVILRDQIQDPSAYNSSSRTHVIVKTKALLARKASLPPSPRVCCRRGSAPLSGGPLMAVSYLWPYLLLHLAHLALPPRVGMQGEPSVFTHLVAQPYCPLGRTEV